MRRRSLGFWLQLALTLAVSAFLGVPILQSMLAGVTRNIFTGVWKSGLTLDWVGQVLVLYWPAILLSIGFDVAAIVLLTILFCSFSMWAVWNLLTGRPSIYLVTLAGVQLILWVTLVVGYFLLAHVSQVQADIWRLQQTIALASPPATTDAARYYDEE